MRSTAATRNSNASLEGLATELSKLRLAPISFAAALAMFVVEDAELKQIKQ